MTATINVDSAGRITLPMPLQKLFGLEPGESLRAEVTQGHIEIMREIPVVSATILSASGRLVLAATQHVPDVARAMRVERDGMEERGASR
jgi:bifunctional DNA-binding transcriptional regulator/antitoxin component of YhaV-PrlF toxin-antitoxin module